MTGEEKRREQAEFDRQCAELRAQLRDFMCLPQADCKREER